MKNRFEIAVIQLCTLSHKMIRTSVRASHLLMRCSHTTKCCITKPRSGVQNTSSSRQLFSSSMRMLSRSVSTVKASKVSHRTKHLPLGRSGMAGVKASGSWFRGRSTYPLTPCLGMWRTYSTEPVPAKEDDKTVASTKTIVPKVSEMSRLMSLAKPETSRLTGNNLSLYFLACLFEKCKCPKKVKINSGPRRKRKKKGAVSSCSPSPCLSVKCDFPVKGKYLYCILVRMHTS